jgi:hypothetical protein
MKPNISTRVADYFWALEMQYEAGIYEVMLWTNADYQSVSLLINAIMSYGPSFDEAQQIVINHVNRGLDWRTLV